MKAKRGNPDRLLFHCPGCNKMHAVRIAPGHEPWDWNGDFEQPTLSPSVLVIDRQLTASGRADLEAWRSAGCPQRNSKAFDAQDTRCHSFVRDGQIQFLSDCTHVLAGQTVPLPDIERTTDE